MGWLAIDVFLGQGLKIERFPFLVGGGGQEAAVDFCIQGLPPLACTLLKSGENLLLQVNNPEVHAQAEINCSPLGSEVLLKKNSSFCLQAPGGLLFLIYASKPDEWLRKSLPLTFALKEGGGSHGPFNHIELTRQLQVNPHWAVEGMVYISGTDACFHASKWPGLVHEDDPIESLKGSHTSGKVRGVGEITCPHCGESFESADTLSVAVHEELRGDSILGPDQMLRFKATKTDGYLPLDAYGYPCPDLACPHCHQKLPPNFLQNPGQIVSLVGGQRAGKSYFLAVLTDVMPTLLAKKTDLRWENHDPEGNTNLENYKERILSAKDANQAAIEKTLIGGVTYKEIHKGGREIPMPIPFNYRVSRDGCEPFVATFYDNAGEHFTPQESVEKNPGSLHVTRASALMFLFDPLQSPKFSRRMTSLGVNDPQLNQPLPDLQEIILAEMKNRIGRVKNLGINEGIDVPLAFIVGKYDAWCSLYAEGTPPPREVLRNGALDIEAVHDNSHVARHLLLDICPAVVRNAEALAPKIMYFPTSTFGHNAVETSNGKGFAPDPPRIKPMLIEAPFLWILSQLRPDLIQTC